MPTFNQILIAAVVALTFAGYILFNSLVDAKSEIKTLKATNESYVSQIEQNNLTKKAFEESHKRIVLQLQEAQQQNKKHASKEHVAVKKTALVEKLANKKFKEQERAMACYTGNESKCSSQQ